MMQFYQHLQQMARHEPVPERRGLHAGRRSGELRDVGEGNADRAAADGIGQRQARDSAPRPRHGRRETSDIEAHGGIR